MNNMHVGIYLNNSRISSVDCGDMFSGNPGIGGTEYCILLLAQAYKRYYSNDNVTLFVEKEAILPPVDRLVIVDNVEDLPSKAKTANVDLLVISAVNNGEPLPKSFFNKINELKIKTILWGHNFYLSDFCKQIERCEFVKANVFVGRQQYDRYIDNKVINKSTYIYNMYPNPLGHFRAEIDKPIVTYIGSLVTTKGFHILAKQWKQVLSLVPNAELNIVGSGSLYSRNATLGTYGVADQKFEDLIMPGLTDDDGNILPSVHFLGVLGQEKDKIISKTSVGVVNPTGRTETFGISALDFESRGVPVVTIAKGGFLDTVIDGETGILYKRTSQLNKSLLILLQDKNRNERYGQNGIEYSKAFAPEIIVEQWNDLFIKVKDEMEISYKPPKTFMFSNLKWLRKINRSIHNPISIIQVETAVRVFLRRLGK